MNADVDDRVEEDVYSSRTYIDADSSGVPGNFSIRVAAENSPLSLSRIFGLLATLTIVPSASRSKIMNVDELAVELDFCGIPHSAIDRFCRKLNQTTEIVAVSTSRDGC